MKYCCRCKQTKENKEFDYNRKTCQGCVKKYSKRKYVKRDWVEVPPAEALI